MDIRLDPLSGITPDTLRGSNIGLEKEGLRVTREGRISSLRHPLKLGSALTHPSITTDFSEALLELVTPPCQTAQGAIATLTETQAFVHHQLGDELIWSASMPCRIDTEREIPIACYGRSDSGMAKQIYRRGLAHRYGRMMQTIAGVHFNYSFGEALWPLLQEITGQHGALQSFIAERYMSTLRNVQRYDWLLLYLFGASPAAHIDFIGAREKLQRFDRKTAYAPYATSLRMSDMGYSNSLPASHSLFIDSNSLSAYIETLRKAVETPHPAYETIGTLVGGKHRQLNTHLLQIENEYYTSVRPKQVLHTDESPLTALQRRGIRYLELRSLDVNPFTPAGVTLEQLRFLELFLHFCLLSESPRHDPEQSHRNRHNLNRTAHAGRDPALKLDRAGTPVALREWALSLFDAMQTTVELLDAAHGNDAYTKALASQRERINNPELTPSARLLAEIDQSGLGFTDYVLQQSERHHLQHLSRSLIPERTEYYKALTRQSLRQQSILERESSDLYITPREKASIKRHCNRSRTLQCACCRG
jgi:glutamate--cysteine ligase